MNNTLENSQVHFSYLFVGLFYFDYNKALKWGEKYWFTCFAFIAVYLLLIYFGQQWMKTRQSYELKKLLFIWNLCLAIFSLTGTYRMLPHLYELWTERGFLATVCMNPMESTSKETFNILGYWTGLFCVSKLIELGDTAFIVLRKKKLVFLHWYHHVTVFVYTWYSGRHLVAPARWFMTVNYAVHTTMYTYFALKAVNVKVPKAVAMTITIGQIAQMVVGLYINWRAYGALKRGEECDVGYENIASSLIMYASYWVLFAHLFYENYFSKSMKKKYC